MNQSSASYRASAKNASPKNNFKNVSSEENKLGQKLGPGDTNRPSSGIPKVRQPQEYPRRNQKSPGPQENLEVNMNDDEYDEETADEFGCVGSNAHNHVNAKEVAAHAINAAAQRGNQSSTDASRLNSTVQSSRTNASNASKKSAQQKEREKNIKNVKMYYWTQVDKGDTNEVYKILSYAKKEFTKANELFEIVNCTNSDGFTPLHLAACEGHAPPIEVLVKFGAQVDARTNTFRTPLHIACLRGNLSVIQALIQHGADINAKDIDGNTPCHFCSEYGHRLCLKFLLTKNPYLFANNNEDKSAIDVAISAEILAEFQDFITKSKDTSQRKKAVSKEAPAIKKPVGQPTAQTTTTNTGSNASGSNTGGNGSSNSASDVQKHLTQAKKKLNNHNPQESNAKVTQIPIHESNKKDPASARDASPGGPPRVVDMDAADEQNIKRSYGEENFLPLKKLGSGSFGDVFLVRDKNSGKLYAMKTLSKRKILGQNLVRYAKTERDVLSYMRHPFIVNLNYAFQTKTKLFLILDFCPGGDLGKIIAREKRFTEDRARLYIAEVLLALQDLHKRDIIYRDLKPDNVVLDDDGHALLTDFGLSKEGVLEVSNGARSFCGSIAYLAPEMLRRVGHGKSVDWYLLGVLLYEMLVGQPPYFSGNKDELFNNIINGPLKLPKSISTEAKNLMVSLLNRNPTRRLGSGPEGAAEIMRHPFFNSVNWDDVLTKSTNPPKPRQRTEHFNQQFPNTDFSKKQIKEIFDDEYDHEAQYRGDAEGTGQNVDGWSFVKMTQSHIEMDQKLR